ESAVLALLGGALGLLLALWGVDALVAIDPDRLPRGEEIHLGGVVVAFTVGISLLTGIVFGVIPALHASRVDPAEVLKEGSRGTAGGRMGSFRNALVVAQIALALVLLTGAGLMTRSLAAMANAPIGFDPHGVLTAKLPLTHLKYKENRAKVAFMREVVERVRHLPGVTAAGLTSNLPVSKRFSQSFRIEGKTLGPDEKGPYALTRDISPGYLETMRIPLVAGRAIGEQDSPEAEAHGGALQLANRGDARGCMATLALPLDGGPALGRTPARSLDGEYRPDSESASRRMTQPATDLARDDSR
ncbi:MAG: hypothetical protein ACMG6S_19780, partial [Byssovorax sp.]